MGGPPVPAVSVIVPAYGVAHLIGETLASLQAQTMADWEAVVVDDGTPDDLVDALAPFDRDPRIRLLQTDNAGVSAARNHGLHHARAPLIALLDGDDRYRPDYLATMTAALADDPALGFVTCDAVYFGATRRDGRLFSEFSPQSGQPTLDDVLRRRFNIFIGCTIRREAIEDVGGFDASLRAAEDLDLWIRLIERGWRCGYVAQPLADYRRRPESLSADTGQLLRAAAAVYRGAAQRLDGSPEGRIAEEMLRATEREMAWEQGDAFVRAGRVREGLDLLRKARAGERSLSWRIAMPLMTLAPPLARPILAFRQRLQEWR